MSTPALAQHARLDDDPDVRRRPGAPLVHAQMTIMSPGPSSNRNVVSGPITAPSTSTTQLGRILPRSPREGAKLQLYDRCSQQILVIACMFVGVGTSALAINGFNDQPAMRIPLIVATIASWFTLAFLFLSSMQVHSLEQRLEWARMKRALMFPVGYLTLSGLAFIVAFLASTWTKTECDAGCRTVGVLVERVLVIVVAAGGLSLTYYMQRQQTLTANA